MTRVRNRSTGVLRKFSAEDCDNLLAHLGDVLPGSIPENLHVEVEISMHDSVSYSDNLTPGQIRVTILQL